MNDGAKVLDDGEPVFELERCLDIKELLESIGAASEECDWWRVWDRLWPEYVGDDMVIDFGLPLGTLGPGDGEAVRENGLLRFGPELEAILQ